MTDVRLTALNPTDSQVYPVACNTSGELLVAGDGTDYLPLTGGNLTGDLTLGTDKITLEAANGHAKFGADIRIKAAADQTPLLRLEKGTVGVGQITSTSSALQIFSEVGSGNQIKLQAFPGDDLVTLRYNPTAGVTDDVFIAANISKQTKTGGLVCLLEDEQTRWFYNAASLNDWKIKLNNTNGSATFTGVLDVGNNNGSASTGDGLYVQPNGQAYLFTPSAVDALNVYQGQNRNVVINSSGSALFTGTVTATVVPPSDARFKQNITSAQPQLADVVALGGILKNYDWNADAPVSDEIRSQRQLGLIAQEAAKICPNLVKELGTEDNRYIGIPLEALIMKLIGAVSELKKELNELKST